MALLDIDGIRARIAQRDARQQECATWCATALTEFPDGVNALGTPPRGNPEFLKHVFGADAAGGVWPILRQDSPDNIIIELGHGAAMTGSGEVWAGAHQSDVENAAWWIAARCGYSTDIARIVFENALMGESWAVSDALQAAAKAAAA